VTVKAIMINAFKTFLLFGVLAIAFSSLTGCPGNAASGTNSNIANSAEKTNTSPVKSSDYPPLPAGIAQADVELLDGSKFKVADRKGKVLLLNLWATWCGPCRAEIPELVAMQDAHRDKGFQVLGLDVGDGDGGQETVAQIKTFGEKFKVNYELARITNETTNEFYKFTKFNGVPISILVDKEGRIRGVFMGGGPKVLGDMKAAVEKLVAEA